ncbi:hypothetical protein HFO09_08955 [Rhizobium laguerreae]|uniref:hypothetical protein n=2 Tax=Rhizobium TaxID=379 RepID=UPI001C908042|nr:hypothetical protein [Rhizobium laguerreae]MBY3255812.1 hypothetical protein [Rhizobium laguerreae]MBY3282851.1 hypothetical protein [Rhizobium laguerreae]MBY3289205.1 hypothetical protein [Rhizobium laguerreae]
MTKSDLSFSEDYSKRVPPNLDLASLHRVRPEMVFGFDPAFRDGETSYGTFRFNIASSLSNDARMGMVQVELRLWGFHIEGRKLVCAVVKRPDPRFTKPGNGWPSDESHFLYSIEAINVACFSHKPDARVTFADCEMFKRIIGQALPAYDLRDRTIAHRNSPKSTLRIVDSTQAPDPQILNFLSCTTNVTGNFEEAEALVAGIDDFFGPDWRQKFDHGYTNTQGIRASGARSEILDALHIIVENCQYWFTYEFTTDSANDYRIPVGLLYTPVFENGIDVSWIGSADDLRRNLPRAETIASWYVYKRLHTMVRRHHPESIINVVSMKGAL